MPALVVDVVCDRGSGTGKSRFKVLVALLELKLYIVGGRVELRDERNSVSLGLAIIDWRVVAPVMLLLLLLAGAAIILRTTITIALGL